jgi:hypothetical protein
VVICSDLSFADCVDSRKFTLEYIYFGELLSLGLSSGLGEEETLGSQM